jgi:hypothetical protein
LALRFRKLISWPYATWLRWIFALATLNVSIGGAVLLNANPICFAPENVQAVEQHVVPVQLFTIFQVQTLTQQAPPVQPMPVPASPEPTLVEIHSGAIFVEAATVGLAQSLHLLEYISLENYAFVDFQLLGLTFPPKIPLLLNPYLSVPQKPPTF